MQINWMLVLGLFNAVLAIYVFVSNRQTAKDTELQQAKERITKVEERVNSMPDHKAFADLAGDMKAIRVQVAGLDKTIAPLARAVDRVNDYLLNNRV